MLPFNNPIITKRRRGDIEDPYVDIRESQQITNGRAVLTEIPYELERVQVQTDDGVQWVEVDSSEELKDNEFYVDYDSNLVTVNGSNNLKTLTFIYKGTGMHYVPATMIYTHHENNTVKETLDDVISKGKTAIGKMELVDEAIEDVSDVISEGNDIINTANEKMSELQTKIDSANSEINDKITEIDIVANSAIDVKINELQSLYDTQELQWTNSYNSIIEDLDTAILNANSTVAVLDGKIVTADQKINELQVKIDNADSEIASKVSDIWDYGVAEVDGKIIELGEMFNNTFAQWESQQETWTQNEEVRASSEIIRNNAEDARNDNEDDRISSEIERESNESQRVSAETKRNSAEVIRISSEITRKDNEEIRKSNENDRETNESTRELNESRRDTNELNRISSESKRELSESVREDNETIRVNSEEDRVLAESKRSSSEDVRKSNEEQRKSAEELRQDAESIRQQNEQSRQTDTQAVIDNALEATNNAVVATNDAVQATDDAREVIDNTKYENQYDNSWSYKKNNIVTYNGSSFIAKQDTVGNAPTTGDIQDAYWGLMSQRGVDGEGSVSSVNGVSPDLSGNVQLSAVDFGAYTKEETDTKFAEMVDSAPETMNTLNELAQALGDDPNFATTISTQIGKKVDKVAGKQLSTEDYTAEEKTKLSKIEDGANKYVHPSTHPATMIVQDPTNRMVTDSQIAEWDAKMDTVSVYTKDEIDAYLSKKVNSVVGKGLTTNDFTNELKSKLDNIEVEANKYIHPTSHPASMITQDATHRFVSDTQISDWDSKETVSGSQSKADNALSSAKSYVDNEISSLSASDIGATPEFYFSDTAPENPVDRQIWIDISS